MYLTKVFIKALLLATALDAALITAHPTALRRDHVQGSDEQSIRRSIKLITDDILSESALQDDTSPDSIPLHRRTLPFHLGKIANFVRKPSPRPLRPLAHIHSHSKPPPKPSLEVPHVMHPERLPTDHPQHGKESHEKANVLHGTIHFKDHSHLRKLADLPSIVKGVFHNTFQVGHVFNAFRRKTNNLVSGYHGGSVTHQIHLSTIPSHAKLYETHAMKYKLNDPEYIAHHTPMLHHAKQRMHKDMENDPKSELKRKFGTFPHAEAGAIARYELAILKEHPHLDAEARRRMAVEQFDRKNLKTFGRIGESGEPGEMPPCKYQCRHLIKHIEKQKQEFLDEKTESGGKG